MSAAPGRHLDARRGTCAFTRWGEIAFGARPLEGRKAMGAANPDGYRTEIIMDGSSAWETPLDALRDHWFVVLLVTLIGAGAGIAYGLTREPVYTAEARLSVGRVDVATQSIPGFAVAAQTLADTYSRAIVAEEVINRTAKEAEISDGQARADVSATPIPETATIRVFADGDSEKQAVTTVNAAAAALVDYVRSLNKGNPQTARLLRRYEKAAREYGQARAELARSGPSAELEAAVAQARLRAEAVSRLYGNSLAGQASPNTLQLLAQASAADSNEDSQLQQAGLAGGVGGFLIGWLLAVLLYRRR